MVKIHNVRFYRPESKAIYCMTLQREINKLALSRSDSNIEIWNLQDLPFIEKIIHNSLNYNIQDIIWRRNRLFSCTLQGFLYEYNLLSLSIKSEESLVGEAAYCLDVNKSNTNVVVGTENGYLNVFDLANDNIKFIRFLDKQEGRILCIKYDHTGNFIVSGGIDAVRIYDANSGHALHKMTTGRSAVNISTIVWCLHVTTDFVIISGDSRGKLSFWDAKMGSQIDSYQSHKADILALTMSEDETMLFCAGMDSTLISYVKVNVKGHNKKWVKSIQRRAHDHDVRSLILYNNKLYSAGIDGYLACSFHPPKTLIKYPPILQNNCINVNCNSRLILLQYQTFIDVWSLGSVSDSNPETTYQLESGAKKLLHLERLLKNNTNKSYQESIICSSISSDGKWIAFSTPSCVRLFKFILEDVNKPQLKLIKSLPVESEICVRLLFTPDNEELILALCSGSIVVFALENVSVKQQIEISTVFDDVILHLLISANGEYLVAADVNSNISVWAKKSSIWKHYSILPKYTYPATALGIQPTTNYLWAAYADHNIIEYQIEERKLSNFSKTFNADEMKKHANKYFPIRNITFDLHNPNIILLHDDTNVVIINRTTNSSETNNPSHKRPVIRLNSYHKYRHLLHLETLSKDELVAVEVNPLQLIEKLPAYLSRNSFGTK